MRVVIEVVGGEEAKHPRCCLANKGQETSKSQKTGQQQQQQSSDSVIKKQDTSLPSRSLYCDK
jgi:hypothetical protein